MVSLDYDSHPAADEDSNSSVEIKALTTISPLQIEVDFLGLQARLLPLKL
jgi:hypothetical protein